MKVKTKYLLFGLILVFSLNKAYTQNEISYVNMTKLDAFYSGNVLQDPEFECRQTGREVHFDSNPLFLNGQVLDFNKFNLDTKGVLTLVKGIQGTEEAATIPFFVTIRRNGKVVEDEKMLFLNRELFQINLSDIFPFSKFGDLLIIKPARAEDWKAKRILKLFNGGC